MLVHGTRFALVGATGGRVRLDLLRRRHDTEAERPCGVAHPDVVGDEMVDADPHCCRQVERVRRPEVGSGKQARLSEQRRCGPSSGATSCPATTSTPWTGTTPPGRRRAPSPCRRWTDATSPCLMHDGGGNRAQTISLRQGRTDLPRQRRPATSSRPMPQIQPALQSTSGPIDADDLGQRDADVARETALTSGRSDILRSLFLFALAVGRPGRWRLFNVDPGAVASGSADAALSRSTCPLRCRSRVHHRRLQRGDGDRSDPADSAGARPTPVLETPGGRRRIHRLTPRARCSGWPQQDPRIRLIQPGQRRQVVGAEQRD